jgi:hypothetical protein
VGDFAVPSDTVASLDQTPTTPVPEFPSPNAEATPTNFEVPAPVENPMADVMDTAAATTTNMQQNVNPQTNPVAEASQNNPSELPQTPEQFTQNSTPPKAEGQGPNPLLIVGLAAGLIVILAIVIIIVLLAG